MTESSCVTADSFSEEFRAESEKWRRNFSRAVERAKAENARLGIVEDFSKYDRPEDGDDSLKVADCDS